MRAVGIFIGHKLRLSLVSIVLAGATATGATAADVDDPVYVNIPAESLSESLRALGVAANRQVIFSSAIVSGRRGNAVAGTFTPAESLTKLLAGTGLTYKQTEGGVFLIRLADERSAAPKPRPAPAAVGAPPAGNTADPPEPLSEGLNEIVVSARKREESILNVPVIETALPQALLERQQVTELSDLPRLVPGLILPSTSLLSVGPSASIRGIGTSSSDPGVDSSISLNIDGMPLSNSLAFVSGTFDLAQVEVLKGPQDLFYGKSSPGGVISLHTADPTDKFEIIGRAAYEFESIDPRAEFIISGPVSDSLKLRLSTMYSHAQGYFINQAVPDLATGALAPPHDRAPNEEDLVIRGTALWNPTDQFSARLKINYASYYALNADVGQMADCPEGAGFAPFGIPFIGGDNCVVDRNFRTVSLNPTAFPGVLNDGNPFQALYQRFGTLELNYRPISDIDLTSTTSLYRLGSRSAINSTHTTEAAPIIDVSNHFFRHEFTEELRASSDFRSPVNFTVGGFVQNATMSSEATIGGDTLYQFPALLADALSVLDIRAYSAFGQVRWEVVPRLELAGGLRWTDETRSYRATNLVTNSPIPVLNPSLHSNNGAPEVTLTYKPDDDLTFFGAFKRAFKSGSYSVATPPSPGANNSFGDERAKGYEVGAKSRLFEHQLALNLAWYDYRYYGLQVGAVQPAENGLPVVQTVNAGSARTYGVDLDAAYHPNFVSGLELNTALNWNHARYLILDNVPCWGGQTIAAGCNQVLNPQTGLFNAQNLNGTPMFHAPEWRLNFGFDYEMPLRRDYKLTFSNSNLVSSRYVAFLATGRPNNDNYQGSYAETDVSLAIHAPSDRWEVALIGKNLTDKIIITGCGSANFAAGQLLGGEITGGTARGPAGVDETNCNAEPGRSVWLRLTARPFN